MPTKKVLILGPIAPPIGGVSIHISRIIELLKEDFEFDFIDESRLIKPTYFNIRSLKFLHYLKKIKQTNLLYIHSGKKSLRIFHLFIGKLFGKKMIVTIHSFASGTPKLVCITNSILYRLADRIVVASSEIKNCLFLPQKKTIIKQAFIPPQIEYEPELPQEINELILENTRIGNTIICANASRLDRYNSQDLYGLDLCIDVTKRLLNKKTPFIFIFVVSSIEKNSAPFFKSKALIKEFKLEKNFLLTFEKLSFVKLMEKADIVVRPTNTDGDSITIREAIFFNKLVLASDVVKRPEGVYLFQNRDINDFEKGLENLIKSNHVKNSPRENNITKSRLEFKTFYTALLRLEF